MKHLERFADDALLFKNCIASSPWTIPSHASLFTGLYPVEHGMHGCFDERPIWGFYPTPPLSEGCTTLAEIFKQHGYRTAAIVSNALQLQAASGFAQGFDIYDCRQNVGRFFNYPFKPIVCLFAYLTKLGIKYTLNCRAAEDINELLMNHIDHFCPAPFFMFINYMDAHKPYRPPRPFDGLNTNLPFPQLVNIKTYTERLIGSITDEDWNIFVRSKYDEGIMYLDYQLGLFFDYLKKRGIYDSSLIVVTSDHGEHFGEHGCYEHMTPMYQQTLHVPLLIKVPFSKEAGIVETRITHPDLFATIVSMCSLSVSSEVSGLPFGKKDGIIVSEFYSYELGKHRAVYDGNFKYMKYGNKRGPEHMKMRYGYKQDPELYNIASNPAEQKNLAGLSLKVKEMERVLQQWEKQHTPLFTQHNNEKNQERITEDMVDGLKALGYIQ